MKAYDWNQLPPTEQDGRIRRVVAGDRITVLRQTIRKGMPLSGAHAHPQEQISIILEGRTITMGLVASGKIWVYDPAALAPRRPAPRVRAARGAVR